jgi:hypothetical protein
MTYRIPPPNLIDRILKLCGIEREVYIPEEAAKAHERFGPYVQVRARRKGLIKTLYHLFCKRSRT